jgi:hypothetical protein
VSDGQKKASPHLAIEIGAFVTFLLMVVGAGIELLKDSDNGGAWFAFVASSLAFLLCIPLLVYRCETGPDAGQVVCSTTSVKHTALGNDLAGGVFAGFSK